MTQFFLVNRQTCFRITNSYWRVPGIGCKVTKNREKNKETSFFFYVLIYRQRLQAYGIGQQVLFANLQSQACKYTYDPEKGDPKKGIPPGTQFEDLPDTWRCPRCKRKKEKIVPVEE